VVALWFLDKDCTTDYNESWFRRYRPLIPFLNQDGNAKASEQRRDSTMSTARRRTAQPTKLTLDLEMELVSSQIISTCYHSSKTMNSFAKDAWVNFFMTFMRPAP
jgi:hypothetical protein